MSAETAPAACRAQVTPRRYKVLPDTLGAVVAVPSRPVPSRLNDQPTLGPAAIAELQAAVSHGLPAFLYDRKNFTLHPSVDCWFAVIPPAELNEAAKKQRRYFPRNTIAVFMPRPSQPYLPTKSAAYAALGLLTA